MSSGFGSHGGTGRCHKFIVDYQKCLEGSDDPSKDCLGLRDDYFECLHHKKEYMRRNMIIDKYRKNDGAKMAVSYAKGLLTQLEIFETKDLVKEDNKWIPK